MSLPYPTSALDFYEASKFSDGDLSWDVAYTAEEHTEDGTRVVAERPAARKALSVI